MMRRNSLFAVALSCSLFLNQGSAVAQEKRFVISDLDNHKATIEPVKGHSGHFILSVPDYSINVKNPDEPHIRRIEFEVASKPPLNSFAQYHLLKYYALSSDHRPINFKFKAEAIPIFSRLDLLTQAAQVYQTLPDASLEADALGFIISAGKKKVNGNTEETKNKFYQAGSDQIFFSSLESIEPITDALIRTINAAIEKIFYGESGSAKHETVDGAIYSGRKSPATKYIFVSENKDLLKNDKIMKFWKELQQASGYYGEGFKAVGTKEIEQILKMSCRADGHSRLPKGIKIILDPSKDDPFSTEVPEWATKTGGSHFDQEAIIILKEINKILGGNNRTQKGPDPKINKIKALATTSKIKALKIFMVATRLLNEIEKASEVTPIDSKTQVLIGKIRKLLLVSRATSVIDIDSKSRIAIKYLNVCRSQTKEASKTDSNKKELKEFKPKGRPIKKESESTRAK